VYEPAKIRILATEPNRKGDLFARLMEALMLSLGYDRARLNIHKSGREIDIQATHRTEVRQAIAECKATEEPSGGGEVNKFVGVLDAERRKSKDKPTEGYFISLAGFTETAIEQEEEFDTPRVIRLDATNITQQLILGRVLVSEAKAMELAGRCVATTGQLEADESCILLAHEIGWVWLIRFLADKSPTHFALIHADGSFIAHTIAEVLIAADKAAGGSLHSLLYLEPPRNLHTVEQKITAARQAYLDYLKKECGEIQLDGLPADEEIGSHTLGLESLFVPLHLSKCSPLAENREDRASKPLKDPDVAPPSRRLPEQKAERIPVGTILKRTNRLAILGLPGGGKSTLLKRIAVAYAFTARRALINDKLPTKAWLPLFIRCRQIERDISSAITDILTSLAVRAEMPDSLLDGFKELVRLALRDGSVLLLVDGLDEIASERERVAFVQNLRTFLTIYPKVSLIVTSREAGFRIIGGALSTQCEHFKLCDFDNNDISRLILNWSKEVLGDSTKTRSEAKALAIAICKNDRLAKVAGNPLLLTTLLLVKRWLGGPFPTKRVVLYQKAIEVLLMTWNVQGHEPLDLDETLPQLEYLAFAMLSEGQQAISITRLNKILADVRREMPELFSWSRISISEFIRRVELRSSLVMQSGHLSEGSRVYPSYEFRHLTFQEYLAARAVVNGNIPNYPDQSILGALSPYLESPTWEEVIPLTAAMAGRKSQPLLQELVRRLQTRPENIRNDTQSRLTTLEKLRPAAVLANCLVDEVQASPEMIETCLKQLVREPDITYQLARIREGKYGKILFEIASKEFENNKEQLLTVTGNLSEASGWPGMEASVTEALSKKIQSRIVDADPVQQALGCLAIMHAAYAKTRSSRKGKDPVSAREKRILEIWRSGLLKRRNSSHDGVKLACLWAEVWLTHLTHQTPMGVEGLVPQLLTLWKDSPVVDLRYISSWLLTVMPLIDRKKLTISSDFSDFATFIQTKWSEPTQRFEHTAAFVAGYYLGKPWDNQTLCSMIEDKDDKAVQTLGSYIEDLRTSRHIQALRA
jgi:hypothetical protein